MITNTTEPTRPDDPDPGCISDMQQCLFAACEKVDLTEVERLLAVFGEDRQAVLDKHNRYGTTVLARALEQGNLPIVQRIVGAGADVNDGKGMTLPPLRLAIRTGNIEIIDCLLDHGGDINLAEPGLGYTLVMNCLSRQREAIALHLLKRGADFSDARESAVGKTTIEIAANKDCQSVFFWLVEHGALKTSGKLALEVAVEQGGGEIVQACLEHPEYCKPIFDQRLDRILSACGNESTRAQLLAWRSQKGVEEAITDANAEPLAETRPARRNTGPAL